jgi:hypothetical protein
VVEEKEEERLGCAERAQAKELDTVKSSNSKSGSGVGEQQQQQ